MNHEKTFSAIKKLQEVEIELHRLKNLLEIANKALGAKRTWVGLDDDEINDLVHNHDDFDGLWEFADAVEAKLRSKNA